MVVISHDRGDSHRRPRRGRAGVEAPLHLLPEDPQSLLRQGAHDEDPGRVGVDDVRRAAAVRDVPLDDVARHGLLPQHAERVVGRDQGVERVDALPGGGGGVGGFAEIRDLEVDVGGCADEDRVRGFARVGDQVYVDCVGGVGACFEEPW